MRKENHLISNALFIGFLLFAFASPGRLLAQFGTGEIRCGGYGCSDYIWMGNMW